ncbi:Haloacid dehalogenase domain protein hydrolase [uncultured delta proteobacterium]|uniref:Haloacid dehalogenase domain protein hydrolase n=1 Tax=uncultured delta proteobacterium TaxID=34034 RepID=A0A212KHD8_9DELT|nr:Haloacid dehalogenase domain protein hydrolase [uncultured delta proteobacterium]
MKRVSAMKQTASALIDLESNASGQPCGLVLDCDGVLFDSKDANTAYYNHIRYAVQLPPMTEEEATYSHMTSTEEALERMIPDELKEEAMRVRGMTRYRDTFMSMMQPAPYMVSFLRNMHAAGLRLALCTNRSDSVHDVLRHFDIAQYFSPIVTITHVQPKPSPQGLLEVAKAWDVSPGSIIFLGDSLVDQQAAAAAGVPFWSYANPQLAAAVHITSFKELDEIVTLMLM